MVSGDTEEACKAVGYASGLIKSNTEELSLCGFRSELLIQTILTRGLATFTSLGDAVATHRSSTIVVHQTSFSFENRAEVSKI
jgi:hypothetical protein